MRSMGKFFARKSVVRSLVTGLDHGASEGEMESELGG